MSITQEEYEKANPATDPDVAFQKCRRPGCDSMKVRKVREEGGVRIYTCLKCGHPTNINVGGTFNY